MIRDGFKTILSVVLLFVFPAYSQPFASVIVTSGHGGDYHAGMVLKDWIPNSKQVDVDAFGQLTPDNLKCPIIFGQGAADELLASKRFTRSFNKEPMAIYSHLIDSSILNFVKQRADQGEHINLFLTDSQLAKLKLSSPNLLKKLQSKESNIQIYSAPMAASSIVQDSNIHVEAPKLDNVIWFGGNYTNSQGVRETFTTAQFAQSLNQIKGEIQPGTSIGLFLMPRVFSKGMTREQKSARVQALVKMFPNNKVTVFANKSLLSQFSIAANTRVQPSYTMLMLSDWGKTRQFASVDQYNLFSDLRQYTLTPFFINPQDEDQTLYAKAYLAEKKSHASSPTILQLVAKYQCSNG
ncbi:hypothetical protein M9194_07045 [Vibrio sp. S4M6]|uniref:hypothetical protein n=1 Tax=Vibrio sinus TaxID=2946865 RepID=UPI00202A89A9|nr:hypothetical protein [Vibrio sinus]MCL9781182.1 hypothetical protein [Vibrio sinus]